LKVSGKNMLAVLVLVVGTLLAILGGLGGSFAELTKYAIRVCLECMGLG
jgi:hypothetical protein